MGVGAHHHDLLALLQLAVDDAHEHNDAKIGVVPGIDQQRLQRRFLVPLGGRQALDDGLQHKVDVQAGLGRNRHGVRGVEANHVLDLLLDAVGLGGGQIHLVEHGHDLVARIECVVDVGQRLRLNPLRSVHDQQRALARSQRARHLIGEIDVAGRVHQVENVGLPIQRRVFEAHSLRLDGDAALALDVHRVEHLLHHFARGHRARRLDQAVGQRGFAMVDVGDDGEIANVVEGMGGHCSEIAAPAAGGKGAAQRSDVIALR